MPASCLLYPLNEFYDESQIQLPEAVAVESGQIPEPCRSILAHDRDMTPTLEETYGGPVALRVLKYCVRDNVFSRQIALTLPDSGTVVLFGAIKIYLDRFPEAARALVIGMKHPLGSVLRAERIAHSSHPDGYFRVEADALMREALALRAPASLYGRRNVLRDAGGATLAQVLEILPPGTLISA
jgi:chorismate-pyruvate lyase